MVMNDTNLRYLVPDITMESFYDMRNAQPSKDKLHYLSVVLEGSVQTNSLLLQKLYNDIISKSNIDFGQIPDSQGALTKYKGYKLMSESIGKINELFKGVKCEEVDMMNKLHDIIISCRKDYEFGFTFNIEIIKITYCVEVMTLYEMINICILIYTKNMRNKNGYEFGFKTAKNKDLVVYKGAKSLIKSYESGQWNKMINEFKKDPSFIGVGNTVATEKTTFGEFAKDKLDTAKNLWDNSPGILKVATAVVVSIIAILVGVRWVVYHFYNRSCKIKEWAKNQQEFVDFVADQDEMNGLAQDKLDKERKLSSKLKSLADFIEVRILKTDADTVKDLNESDKINFSATDFKNANVGGATVIEF